MLDFNEISSIKKKTDIDIFSTSYNFSLKHNLNTLVQFFVKSLSSVKFDILTQIFSYTFTKKKILSSHSLLDFHEISSISTLKYFHIHLI